MKLQIMHADRIRAKYIYNIFVAQYILMNFIFKTLNIKRLPNGIRVLQVFIELIKCNLIDLK